MGDPIHALQRWAFRSSPAPVSLSVCGRWVSCVAPAPSKSSSGRKEQGGSLPGPPCDSLPPLAPLPPRETTRAKGGNERAAFAPTHASPDPKSEVSLQPGVRKQISNMCPTSGGLKDLFFHSDIQKCFQSRGVLFQPNLNPQTDF